MDDIKQSEEYVEMKKLVSEYFRKIMEKASYEEIEKKIKKYINKKDTTLN